MGDLEDGVVPVAEETRVELHDGSSPKVGPSVFGHELADGVDHVLHELAEVFRRLADLGSVLGEVLKDRPEVDQWSPVDVPEVEK